MRSLALSCLLGATLWACSQQTTSPPPTTETTQDSISTTIAAHIPKRVDDWTMADSVRVMKIAVTAKDEIIVDDQVQNLEELQKQALNFLRNSVDVGGEERVLSSFSLRSERATNYDNYLKVYQTLKSSFETVWEEEAQRRYGSSFTTLNKDQKKTITYSLPLLINEAEPDNLGN